MLQASPRTTLRFDATPTNDSEVQNRVASLSACLVEGHLGIVCAPDSHGLREVRINDPKDHNEVLEAVQQHGFSTR